MAPGVAKTFVKEIYKVLGIRYPEANKGNTLEFKGKLTNNGIKQKLKAIRNENRLIYDKIDAIKDILKNEYIVELTDKDIDSIIKTTKSLVEDDVHQAMEAVIHNLNSMNSRAGSQVPFSSLNYGTDTTEEGLGNGETAIFPRHWGL